MLNIILSSAVIVAVLNMIMQNKNNKLSYITKERGKWRGNIRKIAEDLEKCQKYDKKCRATLTKLKVNINSYGKRSKGQYQEDKYLDIMKDEHIWKEIDKIENNSDEKTFEESKNRVVYFLASLLKFDWERSKDEANANYGIVFVSIIYWGVIFFQILTYHFLTKEILDLSTMVKYSETIGLYLFSYMLLLMPYISDSNTILRGRKWYRNMQYCLSCWLAGMLLFFSTIVSHKEKIISNGQMIVFILSLFVFIETFTLKRKRQYIQYENAVMEDMDCKKVITYFGGRVIPDLWVNTKSYQSNVRWQDNGLLEDKSLLNEAIDSYQTENPEKDNFIRLSYYLLALLFKIKERKSPNTTSKKYVLKHPKACKIVLFYDEKWYVGCRQINKMIKNELQ